MKLNSKSINYNVQTVDELVSLDGLEGDTVVVTDENRGGVFVYREDNVGTNNGGTIFNGWNRQYDGVISVKWFGAVGDGVTDDTTAIQDAINYATNTTQVYFPAGNYLVTDTLTLYKGSNLKGVNNTQTNISYAVGVQQTKITFEPSSEKDLFTVANIPLPVQDFKASVSIDGFIILGNTISGVTNSRFAFDLPTVIYGKFANLSVQYFQTGFNIVDSINNRFESVGIAYCSTSCVKYSGAAPSTTDVWSQCTFTLSPVGVEITSGTGMRFTDCIFESLADYGINIYKDASHIEVNSCYGEEVPLTNSAGAMFRVSYEGVTSSLATMLQVTGGSFKGSNSVVQGSFVDIDDGVGVQLTGTSCLRFINVIKTTTNTANYAVSTQSIQYNSCTNYYNDETKIAGYMDFQAVNAGTGPVARFAAVFAGNKRIPETALDLEDTGTDWTPALSSISGAFSSITYSYQSGKYYKIGNMVIASFRIGVSNVNLGTASTCLTMTGLPFSISELQGTVNYASNFTTASPDIAQYYGVGTNVLFRHKTGTSVSNIDPSYLTNASEISGLIIYYTV